MKLLNWVKCRKTINIIILMKLVKLHYTSFILLSMFPNNSYLYFYTYFQIVPKCTSVLLIQMEFYLLKYNIKFKSGQNCFITYKNQENFGLSHKKELEFNKIKLKCTLQIQKNK